MRLIRRTVIALGIAAIAAYLAAVALVATEQTRLVFLPRATLGDLRPAPPFEQVAIRVPAVQHAAMASQANGTPFAWVMRASANADGKPWVIFLHGNDATVATRMNIAHYEHLRQIGLNVLAPEYPGFAGIDGPPSETAIESDARGAYDFLRASLHVPPQRIIVYGWSLGSAVAVDLASHVDAAAVILEGAPSSVLAIAEMRYPWIPVRLLLENPFESILKIGAVHAPVLFLHSPDDQIVPIAEGRRLFDAARPPKQFVEVSGGHILASERDPRFFPAVRAFLARYGLAAGS